MWWRAGRSPVTAPAAAVDVMPAAEVSEGFGVRPYAGEEEEEEGALPFEFGEVMGDNSCTGIASWSGGLSESDRGLLTVRRRTGIDSAFTARTFEAAVAPAAGITSGSCSVLGRNADGVDGGVENTSSNGESILIGSPAIEKPSWFEDMMTTIESVCSAQRVSR